MKGRCGAKQGAKEKKGWEGKGGVKIKGDVRGDKEKEKKGGKG